MGISSTFLRKKPSIYTYSGPNQYEEWREVLVKVA